MNHLANQATIQGLKPGKNRYCSRTMQQNYQDAMAIVRKYGEPDLFITFTCNPRWKEIEEQPFPGQTPSGKPDLIARVFKLKLNELIDDIIKKHIFGQTVARTFVIKFQKRGLPHSHVLIIMANENKPRDSSIIDRVVFSEILGPLECPRLYEMVKSHMIPYYGAFDFTLNLESKTAS